MKTILITGSSRGIGKAIAKLAAEKGYKVIVHASTESEDLKKTRDEIKGAELVYFDVSDKKAVHEAISNLGSIDVLVNNAGIGRAGINDVSEVEDDQAIKEYRVNVLGPLHCIQAVLPGMIRSGKGSVVNISSLKGHYNLTTLSSLTYGATKAALIALTQALAKAYPEVRFNTVSPGYVETDMSKEWPSGTFDRIKEQTIVGRISQPKEIAEAVLFLASESSSYITGTDLLVDGGYAIEGK